MTHTIENLSLELWDSFYGDIEIELSNIKIESDIDIYEGHGFHSVENIDITYKSQILSSDEGSTNITLTEKMKNEIAYFIIDNV